MLRSRVVGLPGSRNQTGAGRRVDDRPARALGDQVAEFVLEAEEDRRQVDGDHLLEGLTLHLVQGCAGLADAGVVEGAVDSSVCGGHTVHPCGDGRLVRHVEGMGRRRSTGIPDDTCGRLETVGVPVR